MTAFHYPQAAQAAERQEIAAERVARFIRCNAYGLWLLLELDTDPSGIEALGDLVGLAHDPLRRPTAVKAALSVVVAALAAIPHSVVDSADRHGRVDLHAAYRWHLARAEDLNRTLRWDRE